MASSSKYDVFISCRGEDTHDSFTSHLYDALSRRKIHTFIDDRLERGDEISPALWKAIKDSEISVIIFSENYASSTWCLDELVHILECKKKHGQIVILVFYRVDPSDVRKEEGNYEAAFAKLEKRFGFENKMDKVHQWKATLEQAANMFGWNSLVNILRRTKVFIVLDDVNHFKQLDTLVGDAFKEKSSISDDYSTLSKRVICYAQGVPLALTVLGSFLYSKSNEEWESTLEKLKELPGTAIVEGIFLHNCETIEVNLSPEVFSNMCSMRLLKIYGIDKKNKCNLKFPQDVQYLPDALASIGMDAL
ncbi:disease resistance protein RPV1-like [Ziziphus jujuba]|uniref:Disease resistance protein RPV1-like n=1 Tax=Ziziphus jujuba TaxID=326968 RepID=A0ABM3I800_ZIZJJ|nr:disease resistance protein RPV1-like [Ziziphus jujuba]